MRLRNWKETVEPTLEEELRAVITGLDVPWTWHPDLSEPVWVKDKTRGKWYRGFVDWPGETHYSTEAAEFQWYVRYGRGNKYYDLFNPWAGNMKPDYPEVRELLRREGYYV